MDPVLSRHRSAILDIAERHGVESVRVIGSRARGSASDESDLDLLIEPGEPRPFFFPGGLVADLEELLGCRVDVVTPDALYPSVRASILADARPL
jgi:predicted nucleotidyltransferase